MVGGGGGGARETLFASVSFLQNFVDLMHFNLHQPAKFVVLYIG